MKDWKKWVGFGGIRATAMPPFDSVEAYLKGIVTSLSGEAIVFGGKLHG
jgi:hypothetical protein